MNPTRIQQMVNQSIRNFDMTPAEINSMIQDHTRAIAEAKNWDEGNAYAERVEYFSQRIKAYSKALESMGVI